MSNTDNSSATGPPHRGALISQGLDGDLRRATPAIRRSVHHAHDDVEMNLVVRGTGTYAMEGISHALKPGTLIWILPDKVHKLTRGHQFEMWVALFRAELFEPTWLEDLGAQPSRQVSSQELLGLDRLFSEVAQESDEPAAYNAGLRYALMRALRASRERPAASLKPIHPAVGRAVRLLRESDNAGSLSDLARAAGVTPHYLSRLLTEQTGRNFVDWRNRVRLDRFIEGYRPGANLLDAALGAGFGSYSRFHHTFTELVGCTPKDWALQVEGGKLTARAEMSAPASGFGLHESGALLSARQQWGALTPMASAWIRALVGDGFAQRLIEAAPSDQTPPWLMDTQPLELTPAEIEGLGGSFHHQDPETATEYGRLIQAKDITGTYMRLCANYGINGDCAARAVGAVVTMAWWGSRPEDFAMLRPQATTRQVNGALGKIARRDPETVRRAFIACACHFVVIREAVTAATAGGETKLLDHLSEALGRWSEAVYDSDLRTLEMTDEGLRPVARLRAVRPNKAGAGRSVSA